MNIPGLKDLRIFLLTYHFHNLDLLKLGIYDEYQQKVMNKEVEYIYFIKFAY